MSSALNKHPINIYVALCRLDSKLWKPFVSIETFSYFEYFRIIKTNEHQLKMAILLKLSLPNCLDSLQI